MPFSIHLERDTETGLDRYVVAAPWDFGPDDAHELCDWLMAAAQNPVASFTLDLSAHDSDERAVTIVVARTAWLRAERRVDLVLSRATAPAA